MAQMKVFNVLGKEVSTHDVNDSVFGIEPHNQAMFDLVLSERASLRQGTHSTKTRTEVAGGGRKPWRQKGTGNARQGSIRSPQWRGGGIVFGPTPNKNYELKVNKKVKKLALKSGWSTKADAIKLVDSVDFKTPSSKDFNAMMKNLEVKERKVMLVLPAEEEAYNTYLSARNFPNVLVATTEDILLDDVLNSDVIIMTPKTISTIEGRLA